MPNWPWYCNREVRSISCSVTISLYLKAPRTIPLSRQCTGGGNGWEVDSEDVCRPSGGLLGIVACNPDHAASAILAGKHHANCDNELMHNLWCFDFKMDKSLDQAVVDPY